MKRNDMMIEDIFSEEMAEGSLGDIVRKMALEGAFDTEDLPAGAEERFLGKVRDSAPKTVKRRKTPLFRVLSVALPLAASLILAVLLFMPKGGHRDYFAGVEDNPSAVYEKYMALVGESYSKIFSSASYTESVPELENNLRSLTEEPVPFLDQLPDEISDSQKALLMKEYYGKILEGVDRFRRAQ